jgi:haloalkane dehalogenase
MTDDPSWLDRAEYPFVHRYLQLPSGRLHYVDEGTGEPVLLVHGTPTWSFEYRHLIRAVVASGRRAIAPDHLGFGLSERPLDFAYTPEAHAENLRGFVDQLGLGRFTLVVHDFGGPIGLPLALDGSGRVTALVLLNTFAWPLDGDAAFVRSAKLAASSFGRFLYRRLNASLKLLMPHAYGDRRKLTREVHRQYLAVFSDVDARERVLWTLARALLGSRDHYASLWERRSALERLPALLVWGMRDSGFGPGALARWREALPHAQTLELEAAGHWPHEEEPEFVSRALVGFLADASSALPAAAGERRAEASDGFSETSR